VFGGFIDDFKVRLDLTLKAMVAGAIMAFAGMAAFICGIVVMFLWIMQTYGTMQAWGAVAALFAFIALVAAIALMASSSKRRELARVTEARAAKAEAEKKKNEPEWWQNPAALLTGLQIARTLGVKGLLPVIAIGAVAAGYYFSRPRPPAEETEVQPAE
jgi:MFS family permease